MKKAICGLLAGMLCCTVLFGCGKAQTPSSSLSESSDAPQSSKSEGGEKAPSGKVVIWGWDEGQNKHTTEAYMEHNPKVTFEYVHVPAEEYMTKVQQSYASGGELPDILWAEMGFRANILQMDIWEDLEAAPYNLDREIFLDYIPSMISNPAGKIVALENAINPAGMSYKRDLAKKYLGTDNQEELEKMFKTYDDYVEKGKEVYEKSDGKVTLFAGLQDVSTMLYNQRVAISNIDSDGNIDVGEKVQDILSVVEKFRDAKAAGTLTSFSPQWLAAYGKSDNIFFPTATWSVTYQVEANDPDGVGNWGMFTPAEGAYSWGGTAYGVCKQGSNKEAAWDYLNWLLTTKDGGAAMKEINFFLPVKSLYDDPEYTKGTRPLYGDQDITTFMMKDLAGSIKQASLSVYDSIVSGSLGMSVQAMMADSNMKAEDAVKLFMDDVKSKVTDIEVK